MTLRETVAGAIGAAPGELFFTSGGTESDNFAILGAARAMRRRGRHRIVTSAAEHHAVLDTCLGLKDEGFDVNVLPVGDHGEVSVDAFAGAVGPDAGLASIMWANNEVGTITHLSPLSDLARAHAVLLHTDAVQALGRVPLHVDRPAVDLMTITAHKCYGPKGVGALYIRKGTEVDPLLRGGGQERGRRPGTENVALAVGFAKAAELALKEMEAESARLRELRDRLEAMLRERFTGLLVNGNPGARLPHILNVCFDSGVVPLEGEMLVPRAGSSGHRRHERIGLHFRQHAALARAVGHGARPRHRALCGPVFAREEQQRGGTRQGRGSGCGDGGESKTTASATTLAAPDSLPLA